MIKTQIIIENDKPKAVILDYKEYLRLTKLAEDREDYEDGIKAIRMTKKLHSHKDVKKKLGLK